MKSVTLVSGSECVTSKVLLLTTVWFQSWLELGLPIYYDIFHYTNIMNKKIHNNNIIAIFIEILEKIILMLNLSNSCLTLFCIFNFFGQWITRTSGVDRMSNFHLSSSVMILCNTATCHVGVLTRHWLLALEYLWHYHMCSVYQYQYFIFV